MWTMCSWKTVKDTPFVTIPTLWSWMKSMVRDRYWYVLVKSRAPLIQTRRTVYMPWVHFETPFTTQLETDPMHQPFCTSFVEALNKGSKVFQVHLLVDQLNILLVPVTVHWIIPPCHINREHTCDKFHGRCSTIVSSFWRLQHSNLQRYGALVHMLALLQ